MLRASEPARFQWLTKGSAPAEDAGHVRIVGRVSSHRTIGAADKPVTELVITTRTEVPSSPPPPPVRLWYLLPDGLRLPWGSGEPVDLELRWNTPKDWLGGRVGAVARHATGEVAMVVDRGDLELVRELELPVRIQPTGKAAYWESRVDDGGTCERVIEHRLVRLDRLDRGPTPKRVTDLAPGQSTQLVTSQGTWFLRIIESRHLLRSDCPTNPDDELSFVVERRADPEATPPDEPDTDLSPPASPAPVAPLGGAPAGG